MSSCKKFWLVPQGAAISLDCTGTANVDHIVTVGQGPEKCVTFMRKREMESMSASAASTTDPKIAAYEKILRGYFGVPQNLVYLLEETTPSFVYETLDQGSLKLTDETFVDDGLKERFVDLVFTCRAKSGEHGTMYVLFEHRSRPDPACVLQLLHYALRIWQRAIQDKTFEKTGELPFILPVIFYRGKAKLYGYNMKDLLGKNEVGRECSPHFPIFMYRIKDIPRSMFKDKPIERYMIVLLRCIELKNPAVEILTEFIKFIHKLWNKNENKKISKYWNQFFDYIDIAHHKTALKFKRYFLEYAVNTNYYVNKMDIVISFFPKLYKDIMAMAGEKEKEQLEQQRNKLLEIKDKIQTMLMYRSSLVQILQGKYGDIPQDIEVELERIEDIDKIWKLIFVASTSTSLEDFAKAIKLP